MIPSRIQLFLILVATISLGCSRVNSENSSATQKKPEEHLLIAPNTDSVIHVFVALCDNMTQGIVPVPARIGNGLDPGNNLYWGCGYGVKTFFKRDPDWIMIHQEERDSGTVLERIVFRHVRHDVLLIADAYNGTRIMDCVHDFFTACSGGNKEIIQHDTLRIGAGGYSKLLAYVGHNALLDYNLNTTYAPVDSLERKAIMLACTTKDWYGPVLGTTGAKAQVWTTSVMAPEAYSLEAAVEKWVEGAESKSMRMAAASAYHKYQKCGLKAAQHLFDHWE